MPSTASASGLCSWGLRAMVRLLRALATYIRIRVYVDGESRYKLYREFCLWARGAGWRAGGRAGWRAGGLAGWRAGGLAGWRAGGKELAGFAWVSYFLLMQAR